MATNFVWDVNEVNIVPPSQDMIDNGFPLDYDIKSGEMNWILYNLTSYRTQVGEIKEFGGLKTSIDIEQGFLPAYGESLCASSTGATYADDRYQDLYIFCWNTYGDSVCPVTGGRGASALADWTAKKFIALPNLQRCTLAGYSPVTTSAFYQPMGTIVGSETVTLTTAEIPTLSPTVNDPGHLHPYSGTEGFTYGAPHSPDPNLERSDPPEIINTQTATTGITINPIGGGLAHNNVQPSVIVNFMIKW